VSWRAAIAVVLAGFIASASNAAVFCRKKNGAVFVRDACKAKEQPVDTAALVGPKGDKGDKGDAGDAGEPGPAGPLLTALPASATLRGVFAVGGIAAGAGDVASSPISFAFPLGTNPTLVVVQKAAATPVGCTGDAATPGAAPGRLCVFVSEAAGNENAFTATPAGSGGNARYGAYVTATSVAAGPFGGSGTWAVIAP
jgi:hypothetical protein